MQPFGAVPFLDMVDLAAVHGGIALKVSAVPTATARRWRGGAYGLVRGKAGPVEGPPGRLGGWR